MKKLLSICFLSILLGLLSFSVSAQNDNGCKSGFWIQNLQPDTVYGVVNMPPDGKLPLVHTLGHFLDGSTVLPGNATIGNTELYELHFCNTCGLDPKTKVSLDWVLLRLNPSTGEWDTVNGNLSDFADFSIYTFYNQLNQAGECQSIRWEGGRMVNGFGYCDNQGIGTGIPLQESISGVNGPCYDPTNYPGAMHVEQGTPMAVYNQSGGIVPANGQFSIFSQNHDYFYLDFFEQTRNIVVIKWKQVGNFRLVMRVRQRLGGTPWMNEYWKWENGVLSQTDYVGGHQSCCGPVLVEDTIYRPDFGEDMKEVCADENEVNPFTYGRPPYTFTETMPDTNVVFGDVVGEGTDCAYFDVDSVNRFHFFVRENPQVQAQDTAICKCTPFGQEELNALVTLADTANKGVVDVRLNWATNINGPWSSTIPTPPTAVDTYHYFVSQTNIYQTIECTGDTAEIVLTINELPAPTGGSYDICNESEDATLTMTVSRAADVNNCSNTSVWFLGDEAVHTGDIYNVTLADIKPLSNVDKVVTYHVYAYNAATGCYSADYATVTVNFHQTPIINLNYASTICPHVDTVAFTMVVYSTQTEFPYTVNQVSDFASNFNEVLNSPDNTQEKVYRKPYSKITDFECDSVYHLYYKVTDANGCVVRDTATFIAKDTIAPVVSPATWAVTRNQCNFEGVNRPDTIKTLAGFEGLTDIYDGCGEIANFTCNDSTYVANSCENVLVRTYTFYDNCNNAATFTQTFTAHDATAPTFVTRPDEPFAVRLDPKRGANCTYNSLSKAEFVTAFLGKVQDNCAEYDYEYLYDHCDFYWQNSTLFGSVLAYDSLDIFRDNVGVQLTIDVVVWDDCGNADTTFAFYFEPDTLEVPNVTVGPRICLGDTSFLYFDSTLVHGIHFDLAHPLTFQWGSLEADINFDNPTSVNTFVVPTAAGYYHVNMTVTDAYGCTATTDTAEIYVKAAPNIVIVPHEDNVGQMPYCPNVGIVWLAARDASNPSQTIPGLTYQWTTSQSLNILSDKDTTGLWIVPDSCTYIYDAQVHVTDFLGCTADASILVPVKDTAPEYIGGIHHDIVPLVDDCKMLVTDFTHYVVDSLYNPCGNWPPKRIWQEPAAGTEMTANTDVTVFVESQCGDDTLKITNKFKALVYPDRITVDATVVPQAGCSPREFTFNATPALATGAVTYKWTRGTSTTAISTAQSFTNTEYVENGVPSSTYIYTVKATDAVGCTATDTVHVTVYETLPEPDYVVYPNKRCVLPYNGRIDLLNMPKNYYYRLYAGENFDILIDSIITQIPVMDSLVPITTIVFDELPGDSTYRVLIVTDKGCTTEFYVYVPEVITYPVFHSEVTPVRPTHCTNDDGKIIIEPEVGFTYYVFNSADLEIPYPYENLPVGTYTIVKENDTTLCSSTTTVTINPSTATLSFTVTATANTLCGDLKNGTLTFTKTNINYEVTNEAGELIYEGPATTITGLAPGLYYIHGTDLVTGCENTVTKRVNNNTSNPTFTVSVHPNQYCDNEAGLVNGSLVPNPAATYTYLYEKLNDGVWVEVTDNTHLAAGNYRITATGSNGCVTVVERVIVDSTVAPLAVADSVVNTVCDPTIKPYDGKVRVTITNFEVSHKPYTIALSKVGEDGVAYAIRTKEATSALTSFDSLESGNYHYKVTDKYFCEFEGDIEVSQEILPDLLLKQTPNTYCVGTYNKPGNGTITVLPPYDEVENYYYSYYYAPLGRLERGDDVNVNYDDLSRIFYWLVDTFYYVQVRDLRTGCEVADTITVELGRDTVLLTGVPTPNTFCNDIYNGSIQLNVTYKPYDFDYSHLPLEPVNIPAVLYPTTRVYTYSIDGGLTYQSESLFDSLNAGVYYFSVYDSITGCVYNDFDSIVVEPAPNDIAINRVITPNHACVDSLYDGTITVSATTTTFDPAEFRFVLDHGTDTTDVVTTWTFTSLADVHTITAIEIHSGCEVDSTFEVPNDDDCNTQIDVDVRKYCLNEENAWITATATSDCEGDFTYNWRRECHNMPFEGASAPVATDREMCCFYTVTATNNITGCHTSKRVEVCVYAAHPIVYTVDYAPIDTNSTIVCENEDLTIGVVHNGWEQAWWTMNHVTDTSVINPEYEFYVNTPDSVAAYASDPARWKFNKNVSFCLDVIDTNGCHAQGLFNLKILPLVRETVDIEVCDIFSDDPALDQVNDEKMMAAIGEEDLAELLAGTIEYPYVVPAFSDTITRAEGCDSIVTYNITVLGVPTIEADVEDAYCYGVKLSDIMENVTINNAADTAYTVNGVAITDMNYTFDYNVAPVNLIITCNSGDADCASEQEISFYVNSIPAFTGELEVDPLCAGQEVEIEVPEYVCNHHDAAACTVNAVLVDSTDAENVVVEVLETNVTDSYLLDPIMMSYNGKYIGFIVTNNCGADTILTQLVVDTIPEGVVSVGAICAHQTLISSWEITNGVDPDEVTATPYVKMPGSDVFVAFDINQEIDYSYNGARLFYKLSNDCGDYFTPDSAIVVNDKPTIVLDPDDLMSCVSEFDGLFDENYCGNTGTGEPLLLQPQSPTPGSGETGYVLPNSTDTILAHGWLLVVENASGEDTYEAITAAQIKEMAKDTIISIMYYATNACGTDTAGPFQIGLSNAPEVEAEVNGTMCLTSVVGNVVTYEVTWHSATSTDGDVIYKVFAEGETISETTGTVINPETTTFNDILTYNGGKLLVIAVSAEECGNDTDDVDLNIPTWIPTPGVPQAACRSSQFSAFIETVPSLAITGATVESEGWYVVNTTGTAPDAEITLDAVVNDAVEVYYKWVTSCGDVITTTPVELDILDKPTVGIDDITICAGDNVNIAEAHLNVTDPSNVVNGESTWTINGVAYSADSTYGVEYNNTNIVVTVPTDCGDVTATATLHVIPSPVVTLTAPEKACSNTEVTFTASTSSTGAIYTFTLNDGDSTITKAENTFSVVLRAGETLTSFHTVTVSVEDENGCASSESGSATVKVTGAPEFIFKTMEGTETHEFEAGTGEQFQYIWMVGGECNEEDLLVYVEYDIYYEGELLSLGNLNQYFCIQNTSDETYGGGSNVEWNTSNAFNYLDNNGNNAYDISFYLGATPEAENGYNHYGNHFPYSTIVHAFTTSNYYDDVWMHFLRGREITQTIAPFKQDGEYKIVFRLYKTNRTHNNYQNSHTDVNGTVCADGYTYGAHPAPAIGGTGFNAKVAGVPATLTLLATDSITIDVTGPEVVECAPVTSAPGLAPDVTVDGSKIVPEMEVWPNPAPAITTTLKAQIHNMSGEATVTLTTLNGTQIYSAKTFIDNDNYHYEFGVNNLSVGSYIMTVRTSDAIVTKKVVVSALAR